MAETIVAAFDSASAAEAAVQDLQRAKIPSASIRSYTKEDPDYTGYRAREPQRKGGFWAWLLGEEPSYTTEYDAYDTSLASGHTVVTVAVDEIHADAVAGIINQHRPTDIHDHGRGASGTEQDHSSLAMTNRADYVAPGTGSETGSPAASGNMGAAAGKEEEVIPLAEEELQVGKPAWASRNLAICHTKLSYPRTHSAGAWRPTFRLLATGLPG
jgi:hypothetical protein